MTALRNVYAAKGKNCRSLLSDKPCACSRAVNRNNKSVDNSPGSPQTCSITAASYVNPLPSLLSICLLPKSSSNCQVMLVPTYDCLFLHCNHNLFIYAVTACTLVLLYKPMDNTTKMNCEQLCPYNLIIYFASAAVAADSSHMTA